MKTKHFASGLTIVTVVLTFLISSCKKDKLEEKDKDISSAVDQSLASSAVNDMTSIADEAGRNYSVSSFKTMDSNRLLSTSCATVTVDSSAAPSRTITVNFGTTNCYCNDGRYRRGVLNFTFTGKYRDSLTVITVTPQNFFVNDNQVTGTKTIKNLGHNASLHLVYEINANIQILKASNGGTVSWQCNRQREWIAGESTLTWSDDMYSITGSATGVTSNGNSFTSTITSPLFRNMAAGCRKHFVSGVLEHTPSGKATRYIDYGNGTCDEQAKVTINGISYTITLP
jgi:hypothetical protein